MRLAIYYPTITKDGRRPFWGQNRQFKFAHSQEVRIYPLVPASAVSWWRAEGHEVLFLDGPNSGITGEESLNRLKAFGPDLVAMEVKAPILERIAAEIERGET